MTKYFLDKAKICKEKITENKFLVLNNITHKWLIVDNDALKLLCLNNKKELKNNKLLERLYKEGICQKNGKYNAKFENSILQVKKPFFLVLKITGKCNFKCDYCYANKLPKKVMSEEIYKKLIKEFLNFDNKENCILLHGGEPLLYFNLIKKIYNYTKRIKKKKQYILFSILTNGSILNKNMISFFKKKDVSLGISIDVLNKNFHRRSINGSPTFVSLYKNLKRLKKEGIKFSTVSVLTSYKKNVLKELVNFLNEFQPVEFKLNPLFGKYYLNNRLIRINNKEYFKISRELISELIRYNQNHKKKIYEANISYLTRNIMLGNYTYMCLSSPCGAGKCIISCDPLGNIYPCDELYDIKQFKLGNILDKNLIQILQSKKIKKLLTRKPEAIKECKDCAFKFFCCSGCPSKTLQYGKNLKSKTPFCEYYKKLIKFIVRIIEENKINTINLSKPYR